MENYAFSLLKLQGSMFSIIFWLIENELISWSIEITLGQGVIFLTKLVAWKTVYVSSEKAIDR